MNEELLVTIGKSITASILIILTLLIVASAILGFRLKTKKKKIMRETGWSEEEFERQLVWQKFLNK